MTIPAIWLIFLSLTMAATAQDPMPETVPPETEAEPEVPVETDPIVLEHHPVGPGNAAGLGSTRPKSCSISTARSRPSSF